MGKTLIQSNQVKIETPYSLTQWANNAGTYSTNSTTFAYIDQTNGKTTITIKNGGLVMVDVFIGGLYSTASNVYASIDVGLDGTTTKSTSGARLTAPATWGADNMGTGATQTVGQNHRFYFTGVTAGSHTFYPIWAIYGTAGTVTVAQYAVHWISVVDFKNA